jgi:N-acetylglutamate synthase-like GNAT family acetyltransferase
MEGSSEKPAKMRVRTAKITDANAIANLSGQLGYPSSSGTVRRRLRNLLERRNHAIWVAETDGGAVVGWIHVFVKHLLESDHEAEIGGLVIDEKYRGQGAGTALVDRAGRWAKSKRLKSVYVRSNIVRADAHQFYQKLGYKLIKTQHAFRKYV